MGRKENHNALNALRKFLSQKKPRRHSCIFSHDVPDPMLRVWADADSGEILLHSAVLVVEMFNDLLHEIGWTAYKRVIQTDFPNILQPFLIFRLELLGGQDIILLRGLLADAT